MRFTMGLAPSLTLIALAACSPPVNTPDASPDVVSDVTAPDSAPDATAEDVALDVAPTEESVTVTTMRGAVVGRRREGVSAFLGIPYAAPPVGSLRWRNPRAPAAWTAPLDASRVPSVCAQPRGSESNNSEGSEDCLTVNVWSKDTTATRRRPVMVFIHGGGFANGSGALPRYEGRALAARGDVVVVTINYRLAQMGFLAHPSFEAEQGTEASGNYGFVDQQFALRWVRDEIERFGGDPNAVTIFGESAGSLSVCLHLIAPGSAGLFHRAIGESASCTFFVNHLRDGVDARFESAHSLGRTVVQAAGCEAATDIPACLRAKNTREVLALVPRAAELSVREHRYQPTIDGTVIPRRPWDLFRDGQFARVPFLSGSNRDEGTAFTIGQTIADEAAFRAAARTLLPQTGAALETVIDEVLALYPIASYPSPKAAYEAWIGDLAFVCPARAQARMMASATTPQPTYLYRFIKENTAGMLLGLGVFHTAELPYVFGNFTAPFRRLPADVPVMEATMDYWLRFASTGDPNGTGAVPWPRYEATSDTLLQIDSTSAAVPQFNRARCDAVDRWLLGLDRT